MPAGRTEVNQGTLTIKNLSPADSSLYDCVATNIMGTKKARINVAVQRKQGLLYLFGVGWWQTPSTNGHFRLPKLSSYSYMYEVEIIYPVFENIFMNISLSSSLGFLAAFGKTLILYSQPVSEPDYN